MDKPRIYIDLNEKVEKNVFLLSKYGVEIDSSGNDVHIEEGMRISIWCDDGDDEGNIDNILAEGTAELNREKASWCAHVKWCIRLDENTLIHESDLHNKK